MADPKSINQLKRVSMALKKSSKPVLTLDDLSRLVRVYPDVLADWLAPFIPMIRMDQSINIRDYEAAINDYLDANKSEEKPKKKKEAEPRSAPVHQREVYQFESIADFLYKTMTSVGGLFDPNHKLTDKELSILDKLVKEEKERRKKAKKKKK